MTGPESDDRQLEELLPWYVNGTLDGEEESRVRRLVETDAQSARDAEILRRVRDVVRSQEFGSPGELGLRRLQASIHNEPGGRDFSSGTGRVRWWRPALAAAAALVIVIQAVMLLNLWRQPGEYHPAGAEPERPVIQLEFVPGASEEQMRRLLTRLDVEIVAGPSSVGVYRVAPIHEGADLRKLVSQLRDAGDVVSFAEVE